LCLVYGEWCDESLKMFESLTTGKMLFAQVVYKSDSVQYVNLLAYDGFVVSILFLYFENVFIFILAIVFFLSRPFLSTMN